MKHLQVSESSIKNGERVKVIIIAKSNHNHNVALKHVTEVAKFNIYSRLALYKYTTDALWDPLRGLTGKFSSPFSTELSNLKQLLLKCCS